MEPIYLGDGVYFSFDKSTATVILTTGTHDEAAASNIIYLEPEVIMNFTKALADLPTKLKWHHE